MGDPTFTCLTREQFERLSIEERMEYIQRAMADLREKLEQTRKQAHTLNNRAETP